jgi:hypothetical protein
VEEIIYRENAKNIRKRILIVLEYARWGLVATPKACRRMC